MSLRRAVGTPRAGKTRKCAMRARRSGCSDPYRPRLPSRRHRECDATERCKCRRRRCATFASRDIRQKNAASPEKSSPWPSTALRSSTPGNRVAHGCRRSEEHTSELQSHSDLVCRLLLEKKKKK